MVIYAKEVHNTYITTIGLFASVAYLLHVSASVARTQGDCFWVMIEGTLYFYNYINYMERSPTWEANMSSTCPKILRIAWKPKVHYRIHKRRPPVPILSQIVSLFYYVRCTKGSVQIRGIYEWIVRFKAKSS
jgi:hypothetical protein